MKRINVLYLETGEGIGGSAKSLLILVKNLDRKTFRPVILVHHKGPFVEQIEKLGIDVIHIEACRPDHLLVGRLVRWIFEQAVEFIVTTFITPIFWPTGCLRRSTA